MKTLTIIQVRDIERQLGVVLPRLYRRLLIETGFGEIGDSAEIYDPRTVYEQYESFFDDPAQIFHPYFPFGCHNRNQELWIIDDATEKAATIYHETVPDDWPDEEWLPYEEWILRYLDPIAGGQ